jgi:enoyl-CoA hydratase/carnithine racemase
MGLPPVDGMSYLLSRRIGTHRALELAYTNDMIDAEEMERIGLVNRVVPHDELMKETRETAQKMFQIPPLTLALTKQCIYKGATTSDIESQMIFDDLARKSLAQTTDQKEAQRSFIENREPVYKGK